MDNNVSRLPYDFSYIACSLYVHSAVLSKMLYTYVQTMFTYASHTSSACITAYSSLTDLYDPSLSRPTHYYYQAGTATMVWISIVAWGEISPA